MEFNSPFPCPNTVTVRRNPHRKARATPSTNPPPPSSTVPQIPSFPLEEILSIEIPPTRNEDLVPSSSSTPVPLSENLRVYLRVRPLLQPKSSGKCGSGLNQNSRPNAKNAWPQNPVKKTAPREKNVKKKSSEVCVTVNDSYSVTLSPPEDLKESKRIKSEIYEGFSHVFCPESSQGEVYESMVSPLVEDFLRGKSGMLAALGPTGSGKTHTIFGCPREPGMVPLAIQHIFKQTDRSRPELVRTFYISIFEIYSERNKGEKIYDLSADGTELSLQQSGIRGLREVIVSDATEAESIIACAMLKRFTAATNANSKSSRSQCVINIRSVANNWEEVNVQSNCAILTIVDLAGAERGKRTGNQGARLLETNFINNTSMVFGLCLRSLFEHQKNPKKPLQKHFHNSLLTKYLRDYLEGKKRMALILTVKPGKEDYLDSSFLLRQASPYMKIKFSNIEEPANSKRQLQTLSMLEGSKRMKLSAVEAYVVEGKTTGDDKLCPEAPPEITENQPMKSTCAEAADTDRNYLIIQKFSKALWNVLKQYKEKLKMAEDEIQCLQKELKAERTRTFELEGERKNLRSRCSFFKSKENPADGISVADTSFDLKTDLAFSFLGDGGETEDWSKDFGELAVYSSSVLARKDSCSSVELDSLLGEEDEGLKNLPSLSAEDTTINQGSNIGDMPYSGSEPGDGTCKQLNGAGSELSDRNSNFLDLDKELEKPEELLDIPPSPEEDFEHNGVCNTTDNGHRIEPKVVNSCKIEKPKRRLLPASSILLKDFSTLHVEDEVEKAKASRGGKKTTIDERNRTQGSSSLLRLLKSNLHL